MTTTAGLVGYMEDLFGEFYCLVELSTGCVVALWTWYLDVFLAIDALPFARAPGRLRPRGDGDGGPRRLPFAYAVHQLRSLSLSLYSLRSSELPATTEGESSRGGSPQGHKAGPGAVLSNFKVVSQRAGTCLFKGAFKQGAARR